MRYSEVDVCLAVGGCIQRCFNQMFLHRRARTVGIAVKEQQSLGQLTIVQPLGSEHVAHDSLVVAVLKHRLDVLAIIGFALIA